MDTTIIQTVQPQGQQGSGTQTAASAVAAGNTTGVFGALFADLMAVQTQTQATGTKAEQSIENILAETGLSAEQLAALNDNGEAITLQDLQSGDIKNLIPALQNQNTSGAQGALDALKQAISASLNTDSANTTKTGEPVATAETTLTVTASPAQNSENTVKNINDILLIDGTDLGTEAGLLERLTAKIENLQEQSEAPGIFFNLTPEQMTQLEQDISAAIENGDLPQPPEGFSFVVVSLVPPQQLANGGKVDDLTFIKTLPFTQGANGINVADAAINGQAGDQQNIKGQLNNLLQNPAANANNATTNASGTDTAENPLAGGAFDDLLDIQSSTDKFSALLKNASKLKAGDQTGYTPLQTNNNAASAATPSNAAANGNDAAQATLGALSGQIFGEGSLVTGFGWDNETLFNMGLTTTTGASQAASSGDLVNLTLQSRHASQGHPSTSMVAATLTKGAASGENKGITLQLDPPELGRIEIRMQFGKDSKMQATIISEKPEAHMMLQRDAQALERALQESGLEAEGNLEFVMADDNQQFSQDGRHDGSRNQAGRGDNDASGDDEMIIETTMNWVVDPETGHTHYSILV